VTRQLARWELDGVDGAVVVIDVIRAFTTAAHAFASGASEIYLVGTVDEALAFKAAHPGTLAMGEAHGLRPDGSARSLRAERVEIRRPGSRGRLRWHAVSDVAVTWEQLEMFEPDDS
jgi:hypothetical protein